MATLKIYRDNTELVEVNIGDDTIRESYFMGDDRVRVSFSYPEIIDFLPYDYIIHNGKRYSIKGNEMPSRKEYGKRRFDYDIVFKSPEYRMHDMPLSHLGESKFDYFGTPSQILALVIDCMSIIYDGFELEIYEPADIEPLHIYFDNVTCRQAVTQACELFGLEYNFDGHVLYVGKSVGNRLEGFTFSQGKGNGLYTLTEVSVPDSPFATRFYGFGGSENLPLDYKSGRKNLVMTGEFVERNIDLYGLIVQNVYFDDIFPTRTGALTAVSSDFLTLTDTSIDFDLNDQQIEGAKIVFTSGELGGQEFEISSYNHATKAMRINRLEETDGYFLPNATFSLKIGDKYKLVGIIMPESYIIAAENKVAEKTIEYAEKHSHPSVGFELELDELELRRRGLVGALNVGTWIHVVSTKLSVDRYLRITELSYPLANPSKITAKISDIVSYTLAERILKDVSGNKNEIAAIEREQKRDFFILSRKSAEQAKLQAERLNELRDYIFDADNYFDATKIKPQSIETQMLSVGAKSQNFYLSGVTMQPNYLGDANRFYVSAGQLQHREISIAAGFIWNLTAQAFYALEPNKTYYLSAKCSKANLTGTYSLTDTPQAVESQASYYHFNIGVLYPVGVDGNRFFANTSGVSYLVGSQITTGRVKSLDGNTWFDLDTGEIRGKIKFTSGQTVESAIDQAKGEAVAQSGVNTQLAINALSVGSRNILVGASDGNGWNKSGNNGSEFWVSSSNDYESEYIISKNFEFDLSKSYVLSFYAKQTSNIIGDPDLFILGKLDAPVYIVYTTSYSKTNEYVKHVYSIHPQGNGIQSCYLRIDHNGSSDGNLATYWVKDVMLSEGNKDIPFVPAPEDLQQQIIDTDNARKVYIDAQDNLKEVEVKAYADGKVSAEEVRAIADATAKANAAKSYADAQDLLLKAQADAYTDGKVTAEESARIAQAVSNLNAAKTYAEAQDTLSKIETKAYADGIVDAEEARAIQDAQDKLNEAKLHADNQANQAQVNAISASNQNISNAINALSIGGRNLLLNSKENRAYAFPALLSQPLVEGETYTFSFNLVSGNLQGNIFLNNSVNVFDIKDYLGRKSATFTFVKDDYSGYEIFPHIYGATEVNFVKLEKGNKATDWTPAPEDFEQQVIDTDNARKAYIDTQDNLKETQTRAYADGKVDAAEQRAIADATAKANAARSYADAQDLLLKAQTDAYADGKVSAEESARITQATNNLNAAKAYAEAQDNLSKIESKAYADGIVDAEEARAIADATAKMEAAKQHSQNLVNNIQIGGRNLLINSSEPKGGVLIRINCANLMTEGYYTFSFLNNAQNADNITVQLYDEAIGNTATGVPADIGKHLSIGQRYIYTINLLKDTNYSHFYIGSNTGSSLNLKNFKLEKGNKATDWTPAPEDFEQQIVDTDNARKAYIDAQDNLKETQTKAYADGIVSAEEARAIADATARANEAKAYAEVQDALLKAQTDAYANGLINSLSVGARNLMLNSKGNFEGNIPVITATPLIHGETYTFSFTVVSGELVGHIFINNSITVYDIKHLLGNRKAATFVFVKDDYLGFEIFPHLYGVSATSNPKLEKGSKATDWTPAPEDVQQQIIDTDNARKAYIDAQDNLKEVETKAYADGIVSAEEARAIADAAAKANAAKSYADTQDSLLKAHADAYADAQASVAQSNAINASSQNTTDAIAALSLGGRNLFLDSEFKYELNQAVDISYHTQTIIQIGDYDGAPTPLSGKSFSVFRSSPFGDTYAYLSQYVKLEIGKEYTLSFYQNGAGNLLDSSSYFRYPSGLHSPMVFALNKTKSWERKIVKFTAQEDRVMLRFGFTCDWNAWISVCGIKIEKGNKATDWTPAPEDLQKQIVDTDNARKAYIDAQDSLKEIQTKAYADGIVSAEEARAIADATAKANAAKSYADNLKVQTDNYINSVTTPIKNIVDEWTYADSTEFDGNKIRTGTVTADKIDTLNLVARHIATSNNADKLTINTNNDNSIKIRHSNGQVGIQMGLVGGVPKLVFFNEYGNKVWEGGMSGIVYVDNVPESWSTVYFKLLPGNHSNVVPDVNGNITSSEKAQLKNWINTSSGFLTTDFGGAPVISSGTTFYSYSAGINAQAENNRVYEGLHTSQIKSTGNWMPNGWYGQSGTALFQVSDYPVQVYATTLEYYANGKMIASILIDDITML